MLLVIWCALVKKVQIFDFLQNNIEIERENMINRYRRALGIKRIQRHFRAFLEFGNRGGPTYWRIDKQSCRQRTHYYNCCRVSYSLLFTANQFVSPVTKRAKRKIFAFLRVRSNQLSTLEQIFMSCKRTHDLIVKVQRCFRRVVERSRRELLDRALRLDFSLKDLHPDWLIEKIAEATFKVNLKNKMASAE